MLTGSGYDPTVTQLQRRLGVPFATAIGVASMLGAGIFFVWAPAAADAGAGILLALPLAAAVAALTALSTPRLAMAHPVSGGAYAYRRAEHGPVPGFGPAACIPASQGAGIFRRTPESCPRLQVVIP